MKLDYLTPALKTYLSFTYYFSFLFSILIRFRIFKGKEDLVRYKEKLGLYKVRRPEGVLIWFNAASVGEVLSVCNLMKILSSEEPSLNFLITSTTISSYSVLKNGMPRNCTHQYAPVDTLSATSRFLDHWRPNICIFVESELWPRLLIEINRRKIPLGLLNARISKKTFRNWSRFKVTAKIILNFFHFVFAQDDLTTERLLSLGLKKDRLKGSVPLKAEADKLKFDDFEAESLKQELSKRKLWVAASTHDGEEEILADANRILCEDNDRYLLILVPRHPERGYQIYQTLSSKFKNISVRSGGEKIQPQTKIYLADTLGELGLWYELADIVFVGGSLVDVGGHNPYEPCRFGNAIINGPYTQNFQEIFDSLSLLGCAFTTHNSRKIAEKVSILAQSKNAKNVGKKGLELMKSRSDGSLAVVKVIKSFI